MKFHDCHFNWITDDSELRFLIGIATGRVSYEPEAKWLYGFRIFFGLFKVEMLWTTGNTTPGHDGFPTFL